MHILDNITSLTSLGVHISTPKKIYKKKGSQTKEKKMVTYYRQIPFKYCSFKAITKRNPTYTVCREV